MDDDAVTKLTFDASGAKQGAADFATAGNQIIAANQAVIAAEMKAADAINAAATRSTAARRSAAAAARDAATIQAAAAAVGGDAVTAQTDRIVTSTSKQIAAVNRVAASFDPMLAAATRAQKQLDTVMDIAAQGGPLSGQAAALIQPAALRSNMAQANVAFANAAATGVPQIPASPLTVADTTMMAAAGASIELLNAQMADLRATLNDGISNVGQYTGAWDRVSSSMDAYIAQATRASAVTAEQIVQARMAQDALNSQAAINQLTGVQTSPGSVGGVAVSPAKSAQQSFAVFDQAGMTADLDAQRKSVDSLYLVSSQYADQYATIQNLKKQGVYNDAQEDAAIDRLNTGYKSQIDGMNRAGDAAGHLSLANAGVTRELLVMGHEVLTGNYTRLGGSMLVIAERVGGLGEILKSVGGFLTSPIGVGAVVGVAAVAGITAFAVAAEDAALRVERLQNALALVRPDFAAASQSAEQAAKVLAQTTFLNTADARTGTSTIYGNPAFQGTPQQAEQIATAFATLSSSLSENETDWKRLSQAMQDPAATLQTLLDQNHLVGVNQALVNYAKLMQEAGDKAGAFNLVLTAVQSATAGTMTRMTSLETALHNLSLAFTKTGQDERTATESFSTAVTNSLGFVIDKVAATINALHSLSDWAKTTGGPALYGSWWPGGPAGGALPAGMVPTTSYGGVAGGVTVPGTGATVSGSVTGVSSYNINTATAVVADLMARGVPELDAIALAAQNAAETGGNFTGPNAVGDPSIPAGVDPTYGAYPGGSHGGFQWNKGRLANFMDQNQGQLPEQTSMDTQLAFVASELANDYKGMYAAAQSAPDLAQKTAIYTGKYENPANTQQQIALRTGIATDLQARLAVGGTASPATGAAATGVINPEGGPTSAFGGSATGIVNPPQQTEDDAEKLAKTMGLTSAAAATAKANVELFSKALTLQPGNVAFQEGLQKANLELYNAAPASAAALRGIDLQTDGETRLAAAWGTGATAAAQMTDRIKAETQATQFAKPGTAAWNDAVVVLTGALNRQAAATEGAQQAQQALTDNNTIAYTQKEIDTLGMEAGARTAVLSALKAQQDAELKYAQNPAAQQAEEAKQAAISKTAFTLQQTDASLSAVASGFSESFDTIGNAMTQSFLSGQGAAVNWANVMSSAAQQVLQQFLKLAVINPLLNSLGFGGTNGLPTLETVGNAINNQAAQGIGLGGMLSGTILGNLLGITGTDSSVASGSLTANDLAFASGSASADLSQIPVPPIPPTQPTPVAHAGWQVGAAAPAFRYIHPAYFDDAPRFHTGMAPALGADEFPAILQRGERVITAKQDSRVLDVMSKLATQAQAAKGGPIAAPPGGQRDAFLPMLAHAETVANTPMFHAGGVVGQSVSLAAVPSSAFVNGSRLHDGSPIGAAIGGVSAGGAAPQDGGSALAFVSGLAGTDPIAAAISSIPGFAGSSAASGSMASAPGLTATDPIAAAIRSIPGNSAPEPSAASFFDGFFGRKTTTTRVFHTGGVVGDPGASALLPVAMFAGAPRFHDGTTDADTQFSGTPAVPSEADIVKALMGPNVVELPSGGFAVVGAPGAYPGDSSSGSSILSTLTPLALPLAMLALKSGSLFSGDGLLSANSLNTAFGTTFGAGTFPSAANPLAIPAGYAADGFTPLAGAVAGVAPDAAAAAADAGSAAASSTGLLDGIFSWISHLFAHQGGVVGDGQIPTRPMPFSAFSILPRFHDGLGADEFLTMLDPGHRVLTADHQSSLIQTANAMGVGPGLASILQAPPAATASGAFPAILQHGEQILGQGQQADILALMAHGSTPGGIQLPGPSMPSSTGYSDPIPRFHEGYGGQDLLDVVNNGDRAMADRQQGAADAAAAMNNTTNNEGHTINITLQGVGGNGTPDTFRRAGNQVARTVLTALSRAATRDS